MKRKVTVEVEIDPKDYFGVHDTDEGAAQVVVEMIRGAADWPENGYAVFCGKETITPQG